MTLHGWTGPLTPACEAAIAAGMVIVYVETIKGVTYQLLRGSYRVGSTVISFL